MTRNIFSATVRGLRGPGLTSAQETAVNDAIDAGENATVAAQDASQVAANAQQAASDAADLAQTQWKKADHAVATFADREAIPLATRHYGLTVHVTQAGRDFRWTQHGHSNGVDDDWVGLMTDAERVALGNATGTLSLDKVSETASAKIYTAQERAKLARQAAELGGSDEWAAYYFDMLGRVAGGLRLDGKTWEMAGQKVRLLPDGSAQITPVAGGASLTLTPNGRVLHSGSESYDVGDDSLVRVTHDSAGRIAEVLSDDGSYGVGGFWLKPTTTGAEMVALMANGSCALLRMAHPLKCAASRSMVPKKRPSSYWGHPMAQLMEQQTVCRLRRMAIGLRPPVGRVV